MDAFIVLFLTINLLLNVMVVHRLQALENKFLGSELLTFEPLEQEVIVAPEQVPQEELAPIEPILDDSHLAWRNQKDITHVISAPAQHKPLPTPEPMARPYGFPG